MLFFWGEGEGIQLYQLCHLLIYVQSHARTLLDLFRKFRATMADLEAVINADRQTSNETNKSDTPTTSEGQVGPSMSSDEAELLSDWPPDIGQHIAGNFTDGFYIGEVKEIIDANTAWFSVF